jgi:aminoglycoside phosphotransferase (APT) family kinase protein
MTTLATSNRLTHLWETEIAPKTGLSGNPAISETADGITTEVHFVSVPEGEFVLRLYGPESSSRLKGYLEAHKVFTEIGAHVPERIGCGDYKEGSWLVERKIGGAPFRTLFGNSEALKKAAQALAFLHGHERRRYGKVGAWGGKRLSVRWRQRFEERWSKIIGLFPEIHSAMPDVEAWFQDWASAFAPGRYQLLHGDFHPGNLALEEDGTVALLDFRSPKYGFGLVEMIEAAHHFTGEDPRDWEPFVSPYLAARDEAARGQFSHFATALHAVFHLRHADRFADLAVGKRGMIEDHRRWERNALDSWLRFCDLAGILSPAVSGIRETAFPSRT